MTERQKPDTNSFGEFLDHSSDPETLQLIINAAKQRQVERKAQRLQRLQVHYTAKSPSPISRINESRAANRPTSYHYEL